MNSNSEYFSATGEFVYPTNDKVYTYPYLTYLSIEIGTFHELFIILQRLPNLKNFESEFVLVFFSYNLLVLFRIGELSI